MDKKASAEIDRLSASCRATDVETSKEKAAKIKGTGLSRWENVIIFPLQDLKI